MHLMTICMEKGISIAWIQKLIADKRKVSSTATLLLGVRRLCINCAPACNVSAANSTDLSVFLLILGGKY